MRACLEREDCTAVTDYFWLGRPDLGCWLYVSSCDAPSGGPWRQEDGGRNNRKACLADRNLLSLTELGILVRTQLGDNVWRYELPREASAEHGEHPHFVCIECGDIACLTGVTVSPLRGKAAHNQVTEIQLRGRCGDCTTA